jgi:hypothetical protein
MTIENMKKTFEGSALTLMVSAYVICLAQFAGLA